MKCIKQRLLILCLCAFTSTAFAQTYEVLMKTAVPADRWSTSRIFWRFSRAIA